MHFYNSEIGLALCKEEVFDLWLVVFRKMECQDLVGLSPTKKHKMRENFVKRHAYRGAFHLYPDTFMLDFLSRVVSDTGVLATRAFEEMKEVTGQPAKTETFSSAKAWFDNLTEYTQCVGKHHAYNFFIRLLDLELEDCGADADMLHQWRLKRSQLVGFTFDPITSPAEAYRDKERAAFMNALVRSKGRVMPREKAERQEWWQEPIGSGTYESRYNGLVANLEEGRDWVPQFARKEDAMESTSPLYYKLQSVVHEHDRLCKMALGSEVEMESPYTRHSGGKFTEIYGTVCPRQVTPHCTVSAGLGDGFATLPRDESVLLRPYMAVARRWAEGQVFFLPPFEDVVEDLRQKVFPKVTEWLLELRKVGVLRRSLRPKSCPRSTLVCPFAL